MGIFFREVVLDLPGIVVTQPIGERDLFERVLQQLVFAALVPWPRQLVLVEHAEFHARPALANVFCIIYKLQEQVKSFWAMAAQNESSNDRRQAIIRALHRCIREQGYAATSLTDIALKAK